MVVLRHPQCARLQPNQFGQTMCGLPGEPKLNSLNENIGGEKRGLRKRSWTDCEAGWGSVKKEGGAKC